MKLILTQKIKIFKNFLKEYVNITRI